MGKRIIFIVNSIVVLLNILLFVLIYIPPSQQSILTGATLLIPLGIAVNIFFFVYWLVKLDKRVILSLALLLVGHQYVNRFFSIHFRNKEQKNSSSIRLASFNTLHFKNQLFENKKNNDCFHLFSKKGIDVLGLQESNFKSKKIGYKFCNYAKGAYSQSWIYSNYKLKQAGVLNISTSTGSKRRDFTFADIHIRGKEIRIYNVHFFSYKLPKQADQLKKSGSKKLISKISNTYKVHEEEVNQLIAHIKKSPYPVIVMGDFNNNAYSYEYTQLLKQCNLKDTFVEAGSGFGATYDFKYFPTRIDFILVPEKVNVHSHEVLKIKEWSDHYPIITEISF